jgi:hypothetical protein
MTHQAPLFCESLTDAIRDVVRACGGTKVVGCKLWPEKTPDAAARLLADCLNDSRPERLTPDHLMLLARMGRERGCHSVMAYMLAELGYAPPVPVEPADEAAELQRKYVEATKALLKMAERIERLRAVA